MDENMTTEYPEILFSDEVKNAYFKVFGKDIQGIAAAKIHNPNVLSAFPDAINPLTLAVTVGLITKAQAEIIDKYQTELEELYPIESDGSNDDSGTTIEITK